MDGAARDGDLAELQRLRTAGRAWTAHVCMHAAYGGHLELIQWACANGCPWDKWTCHYAALYGHLKLLRWARAHGCPWDKHKILSYTGLLPTVRAWVASGGGDGARTKSAAARQPRQPRGSRGSLAAAS